MLDEQNRLKALMIIWGSITLLSVLSFIFLGGGSIIVVPVLAGCAWLSTDRLFEQARLQSKSDREPRMSKNKPQNETGVLLSLLSDDDLYELRTRVKARLLDDAYQAVDGELSTLDVLLSEQEDDDTAYRDDDAAYR